AFLIAFSGSDFPASGDPTEPPGTPSNDAHAAVGHQITLDASTADSAEAEFDRLKGLLSSPRIRLTARWLEGGVQRGAVYDGSVFHTDAEGDTRTRQQMLAKAESTPVTFTIVAAGTEERIARDRDEDGTLDFD